jgi:ATP-dependent Clp protease ATP-binding subunit ClpC
MIPAERLSPQAMLMISNARQEAKRAGNQLVGTEHILLGIITTDDVELQKVLLDAGLSEEAVRKTAGEIIVGNRPAHARDDLDFTPRVQRLIDRGFAEAELLGDPLIEPKHVLIAMLREDAGMASRILERTQVNTTMLLKALLK